MSHAPYDPTHPATAAQRQSRVLPLLGGALGLVGLIVGAAGCSQAVSSRDAAAPSYSEQQVADAKKAVCEAYADVRRAFASATNQPEEKDPANKLLIAVNVRLAEYAGADYLSRKVDENSAVPESLAADVRQAADTYRELAIRQLADAPTSVQQPLADKAAALSEKITGACA